jgi:hypothetical protein
MIIIISWINLLIMFNLISNNLMKLVVGVKIIKAY